MANNWIRSIFVGKKQMLTINGILNRVNRTVVAVPEGSIFSLLLVFCTSVMVQAVSNETGFYFLVYDIKIKMKLEKNDKPEEIST